LEAAILLLDAVVLGSATPGTETGQARASSDVAGSQFGDIVRKLLGECGITTAKEDGIRAGQQTTEQEKEPETGSSSESVEMAFQMQCLLGSAGVVKELPEVVVPTVNSAPAPSQEADRPVSSTLGLWKQDDTLSEAAPAYSSGLPGQVEVIGRPVDKPVDVPQEQYLLEDAPNVSGIHQQETVIALEEQSVTDDTQAAEKTVDPKLEISLEQTRKDAEQAEVGLDGRSEPKNLTVDTSKVDVKLTDTHKSSYVSVEANPSIAQTNRIEINAAAGTPVEGEFVDVSSAVRPVEHSDIKRDTSQGQPAQNPVMTLPSEAHITEVRGAEVVQAAQDNLPTEQVASAKMIHQIVIAAKVQMTDSRTDMTLRLDPPHLGMLKMNVTVAEGVVSATLHTSTEAARQILQSDLSSLRQALADSGINVDTINVSVGTDSGSGQLWNPHSGGHNPASEGKPQSGPWHAYEALSTDTGADLPAETVLSTGVGRLNLLA